MALGIPLPGQPGDSLLRGVDTGSTMFARLMQPKIQRENMARQWREHMDNLKLQQAAAARAAAMAPLQQRLAQLQLQKAEMEADPLKKMAYIQSLMTGIRNMNVPRGTFEENVSQNTMQPFSGSGMASIDEMQNQSVAPQSQENLDMQNQNNMGGFNFTPEQQMALSMAGIKIPTVRENPDEKRFKELQNKIKFENEKANIKKDLLQDKEVSAAKKDMPVIKNSIEGVDELIKIAKENPDMFGHGFMPDLYAKTTKNQNFGTWQNLIADRIAGLESKLSSRGNIVALKLASSLKPSHAESQQVAIGKLESMKKELQKQLQRSQELTGQKTNISNNLDLSQLSDEELQRIAEGG